MNAPIKRRARRKRVLLGRPSSSSSGSPPKPPVEVRTVVERNAYGVEVIHVVKGKKVLGRMYHANSVLHPGKYDVYRSDFEATERVRSVEEGIKFLQRKVT
jgi:hypothetical protein